MSLNLENVYKKVKTSENGEITILENINLSIPNGELTAISGKSGAGKSTLLHILGGTDLKSSGKYFIDGQDIDLLSERQTAALRNKIFGYIMQDFGLINEDTVYENIALPLYLGKGKIRDIDKKVKEKITMLGIENLTYRQVEKLSGGEKQRVAIARALINEPKYILADEPTGSLDSKNAQQVINIMKKLQKMGKTIIIVTHDMDIAAQCDRRIEISDGRLII